MPLLADALHVAPTSVKAVDSSGLCSGSSSGYAQGVGHEIFILILDARAVWSMLPVSQQVAEFKRASCLVDCSYISIVHMTAV